MTPRRVVLVGFMGAGKTTVGRRLAERLGWDFVDLDEAITATAGRTVGEIFEAEGEAAFRAREEGAARALAGRERVVVAAGGGAFAREPTRSLLQQQARTVWLRCDPEALFARIPLDGSRPLATNRERIAELLAEREPSYHRADWTLDTTRAAPDEVAETIARLMNSEEARNAR